MATKTINWETGGGTFTVTYGGSGNGTIVVTSDANTLHEGRSQSITVKTTKGGTVTKTITVTQAMKPYIDLTNAVVSAANQTYSGSALTPVPTVTLNGETVPSTGYDVTYINNTNAGTATITITGKGDYTGTASGSFTIAKANPVYTAPSASVPTYSGSTQNLVSAGSSSHGTFTYSTSQNGTYSSSIPQGTNAGTYTVWWKFTGDANHNNVSATQVSGVSIATKALSITAKAQTITYGDSIATGTGQVTTSGLVTGDSLTAITLTASTSNVPGGVITPSAASTTKGIGNYSVTYTTGTLTINKAAPTYTAPTAKSLSYSRGSQALLNAGSTSHGTIQYSSNDSSWGTTIPSQTNAGSYTVYWRLVGDSNHTDVSSTSINVTIAKVTPVVATAPSARTGLTYTGSNQNLLSGGSMKHSSSDTTAVAGTFTYALGKNAGTYSSLTWSFAPTDSTNYNSTSGTVSGSVSIAKANPVYTAPTANNRTYNTSSAALLNAGSSTTAGSFTYCATQSGTYTTTIPTQTNAGTYTTYWKFTPTDTTNYNSIGATAVSTTISAKTVSSPTITLSQSTYTYSGSACQPTATVKDGSTTISSSEYTVSYSNNTNVGTATVTITDKSGGNYTVSGSTTFTINKANPTYTAPAANNWTYNGSSYYLVTAGSTSHGTIYYSSDGSSWSTTRPSKTNAGTYTTYWKLTGDSNHNDVASTSISTTVSKATPTYTAPTAASNLSYTGSAQYLTTTGSTSHGTIYYSSDNSTWYTTRRTGTTAGSYTTYWKLTGDSNHSDISSTSISTSIAKASRTLSFSDVYDVVAPSGTITKTATPSAGSGDGAVTYSISSTTYATINSSTGKVTAKTSEGSATVTATVAEGTNYQSASVTYTLYVFSTTHNFDYTGSVQNLLLPPGSYKLECWGAQGGSNVAASSYGITAKAGGKGGYSTGQLTLSSAQTVYVFVGGQGGSSGNGGWNGGGGGEGSSQYTANNHFGISKFGCGGGGTDIALTTSSMSYSTYRTNRSSASYLSRMIVAGGGSGGAMCYKSAPTTSWQTIGTYSTNTDRIAGNGKRAYDFFDTAEMVEVGTTYRVSTNISQPADILYTGTNNVTQHNYFNGATTVTFTPTVAMKSGAAFTVHSNDVNNRANPATITIEKQVSTTATETDYQVGYVGGGTTGGGYSSTYWGSQNAAGNKGGFGYGANQEATTQRYCSACAGGGWYGGGRAWNTDSPITTVRYSGGGSGFVNTAANASYRPSGYTGLQLDSGSTYDGSQTFKAPSGSNETGHSGNGYAKITRL